MTTLIVPKNPSLNCKRIGKAKFFRVKFSKNTDKLQRFQGINSNFAITQSVNMTNNDDFQDIKEALNKGQLDKAQLLAQKMQKEQGESALLFYWQGKIHMKRANWSDAMTCFLHAEELDPESPAKECRLMLHDIMEFYNKDMYNQ